MATFGGIKPGLNPAKRAGSGPDNRGLEEAEIDVAQASDIGIGTIVYRSAADGTIQVGAAADGEDAYGVCRGVSYVRPADGEPVEGKFYPGGLNPVENALCKVSADPAYTYLTRGNASVASVFAGQIYAMEASSVDVATGHETALVDIAGGTTLGNDSIDVEIVKVHDLDNRILEVRLVRHELDR